MFTSNTPKQFWGDAVLTVCYLINRMPSKVLQFQTPLSVFSKSFPENRTISSLPLKVFGCMVFAHNNEPDRNKLDKKAFKSIFLGYAANQKGYKCYIPEKRKLIVTMDLTFFENTPFFPKNSLQGEKHSEEILWDNSPESFDACLYPSHSDHLDFPVPETCGETDENKNQGGES